MGILIVLTNFGHNAVFNMPMNLPRIVELEFRYSVILVQNHLSLFLWIHVEFEGVLNDKMFGMILFLDSVDNKFSFAVASV